MKINRIDLVNREMVERPKIKISKKGLITLMALVLFISNAFFMFENYAMAKRIETLDSHISALTEEYNTQQLHIGNLYDEAESNRNSINDLTEKVKN